MNGEILQVNPNSDKHDNLFTVFKMCEIAKKKNQIFVS